VTVLEGGDDATSVSTANRKELRSTFPPLPALPPNSTHLLPISFHCSSPSTSTLNLFGTYKPSLKSAPFTLNVSSSTILQATTPNVLMLGAPVVKRLGKKVAVMVRVKVRGSLLRWEAGGKQRDIPPNDDPADDDADGVRMIGFTCERAEVGRGEIELSGTEDGLEWKEVLPIPGLGEEEQAPAKDSAGRAELTLEKQRAGVNESFGASFKIQMGERMGGGWEGGFYNVAYNRTKWRVVGKTRGVVQEGAKEMLVEIKLIAVKELLGRAGDMPTITLESAGGELLEVDNVFGGGGKFTCKSQEEVAAVYVDMP
jgi:hypothetical protein